MKFTKPILGDKVLVQSAHVPCRGIYMVGTVVATAGEWMLEVRFDVKRWLLPDKKVYMWFPFYETMPGDIIGTVEGADEIAALEKTLGM